MPAGHRPTSPHRTPEASRPAWLTPSRVATLLELERLFGVHLVVYVRTDALEPGPQLCQLYRKADYTADLARRLTALENELPDGVVVVAYRKPWQRSAPTA